MLKSGLTIGIYEILSPIGAGGMGEVYLAKDSRLDRLVAIKALPEHLAADPDRLGRFEREAKTLASLNHPNVAGIYGVEEQDGRKYLILEYVEGETLAERLDRGAMPVDEALEVCTQIAAGVEAAHEAGIIHRDLKPANVKITPEGKVKVLDFGLAKVAEGSSSSSFHQAETVTSPAYQRHSPTMPGVILGTAAYMSPEQARGRSIDKRTDIWSFGVVLYECLTGANPFLGETVTDSMGAILHKEPQWSLLPANTPPTVRLLLRRCLTRDHNRRLRDIGDARIEIETAIADSTSSVLGLAATAVRGVEERGRSKTVLNLSIVGVILLVGVLSLVAGRRMNPPAAPLVRKYEIPLLQQGTWNGGQPAVNPDGTMIAYVDQDRIWIRRLDSFDAREVPESDHGVIPFWSPDSNWLGFGRGSELVKVPATGGRPTVIAKAPGSFSLVGGAAWSRDNRILFSTGNTGILEGSADGGVPRVYVPNDLEDDDDFHELTLLPDDKSVVFTVHSRSRPWYLAASDGTQRKVVLSLDQHHLVSPAYSPTGHILYTQLGNDQSVWALPFSTERLEAAGAPFLVAPGDGDPSVSDTGVLALTRRIVGYQGGVFVAMDPASGETEPFLDPGGVFLYPSLSPDGTTMALAGFDLNAVDIWLLGIEQGTRTRLTFDDSSNEVLPQWSSDGREIAYAKTKATAFQRVGSDDTIHFIATDGSGETRDPVSGGYPTLDREWNFVAFVRTNPETGRDIYYQPLDGSTEARPIVQTHATEEQPALSPDGKWLAYTSDESGGEQIYLTRFPSAQGKWQVSTVNGVFSVWSPDSTRLYFTGPNVSIFEVQIITEPRVMLSKPRLVVSGPASSIDPFIGFGFTADGQHLIVVQSGASGDAPAVGVIENWYEEFRGRR